jgi:transcriptional regulator with PAS, ATPase and Fis domain
MKVNRIMEYIFETCNTVDSIRDVVLKMIEKQTEFLVVTTEYGRYFGVVSSTLIMEHLYSNSLSEEAQIGDITHRIPAIRDSEKFLNIKEKSHFIIPVVNKESIPVGVIRLRDVIEKFVPNLNAKKLGNHANANNGTKYTIDDIIGESPVIQELKEKIIKVAKIKSTVLILGETGVGKELTAHAIVNLGKRRFQPFAKVNCAAIPDNLLESELFGYEPGAFTGAVKTGATGKFEAANNGTLFLDEIGDMKLIMQGKILRVLQEKEIEKIGGVCPIPIDVRIIAATHTNLSEMVENGEFRKDLFYRLNVIPIIIPPLRSHREDIPLLINKFAAIICEEMEIDLPEIAPVFYKMMQSYHWPGNIRELRNAMEMVISFSDGQLDSDSVVRYLDSISYIPEKDNVIELEPLHPLKNCASESERETITEYLLRHNGNKKKVADSLGISRSTLYYKLKKLNINEY